LESTEKIKIIFTENLKEDRSNSESAYCYLVASYLLSRSTMNEAKIQYKIYTIHKGKGKGKAVQLQAWSGPEGSRKLRFPDFMTMAKELCAWQLATAEYFPSKNNGIFNSLHFSW
jgi:hypothetical protein